MFQHSFQHSDFKKRSVFSTSRESWLTEVTIVSIYQPDIRRRLCFLSPASVTYWASICSKYQNRTRKSQCKCTFGNLHELNFWVLITLTCLSFCLTWRHIWLKVTASRVLWVQYVKDKIFWGQLKPFKSKERRVPFQVFFPKLYLFH
jgi:hypothetical protein